jgi:hypothetical protein
MSKLAIRMAPLGLGALPEEATMERIVERGCGLDVHKKSVAACLRVLGANGQRLQEGRTFGTTAAELLALRDWLEGYRVTHVAMESTGVYWKPIVYVLEEALTCVWVNPVHRRQVPGRQTDVQDCVWIAQLLEHGLLRGSFVPPVPIRELHNPEILADLAPRPAPSEISRLCARRSPAVRVGKTRRGHRWLRTALIKAALAASALSTTAPGAPNHRLERLEPDRELAVAGGRVALTLALPLPSVLLLEIRLVSRG